MSAAESPSRPAWVRLKWEAWERGFRRPDKRTGQLVPNTLQFRRWCQAHGVEIKNPTGRLEWVSPVAIDRAIAGELPPAGEVSNDHAGHLVATLMGRR